MSRKRFLRIALEEAKRAYAKGEVPVGCVLVKDSRVIASAHNLVETTKDPTAHAEMIALREGSKSMGDKRLQNCTLYVTLEPCIMCAYALVLSRVEEVVFGALDEKHGGVMSLYSLLEDERFNHRVRWVYEPTEECSKLLSDFFRAKRDGGGSDQG